MPEPDDQIKILIFDGLSHKFLLIYHSFQVSSEAYSLIFAGLPEGWLADVNLTQADADTLLAMEKHRVDDTIYDYPGHGGALRIPLQSTDKREEFTLDITRSRIKLSKGTYQNRARGAVILARLDFGGAPHRNPNDEELDCPHLHIYREGFSDRWAEPLPAARFRSPDDRWQLLMEFMRFVNITILPNIQRGLFT